MVINEAENPKHPEVSVDKVSEVGLAGVTSTVNSNRHWIVDSEVTEHSLGVGSHSVAVERVVGVDGRGTIGVGN